MSTPTLLFKTDRFLTADASYIGEVGEITFNAEDRELRLHDGVVANGSLFVKYPPEEEQLTAFPPVIINPAHESDTALQPTFVTLPYNGQGTHTESRWVIATDSELSTVVFDSDWDASALETLDLEQKGVILLDSTTYYIRVVQRNQFGHPSPDSNTITFTVIAPRPVDPWIQAPSDGERTLLAPIFQSSTYSCQDAHGQTRWVIASEPTFETLVVDTGWSDDYLETLDLVDYGVSLTRGETYYATVQHRTEFGYETAISPTVSFIATGFPIPDVLQAKLLASDGEASDHFGASLAISDDGSCLLVGAPFKIETGTQSGAAYVFRFNGEHWVEEKKLLPSNGAASERFGHCVAFNATATLAVIGVYNDTATTIGQAYIFRYNGSDWVEEAVLSPSDGAIDDCFGYSVAINDTGDTLLVGAVKKEYNGVVCGSVYVFRNTGTQWIENSKLPNSQLSAGCQFGHSVSLNAVGDVALVGLPYFHLRGWGKAAIYRDTGDGWVEEAVIDSPNYGDDRNRHIHYGMSVALNATGDLAFVSAPRQDLRGRDNGLVYVFTHTDTQWSISAQLTGTNSRGYGENFGSHLSVNNAGTIALCSEPGYEYNHAPSTGRAFVYTNEADTWYETHSLAELDYYFEYLHYSSAVALSGPGTIGAIGVMGDNTLGTRAGCVYVYV